MRNKWEESAARDLETPASITEREWRSLRRRVRMGVFAMLLALLSTGVLGYAMVAGNGKLDLAALRGLLGSAREAAPVQAAGPGGVGANGGVTSPDSSIAPGSASSASAAPDSNAAIHAGY